VLLSSKEVRKGDDECIGDGSNEADFSGLARGCTAKLQVEGSNSSSSPDLPRIVSIG
jgi:hypothetical protein